MNRIKLMLWLCVASLALAGCAARQVEPQRCANSDLADKVRSGEYVQKVDNFLIVLDESSSMFLDYNGRMKADLAEEIVGNMALLIPAELKLKGAVRVFGPNDTHPVVKGSKPLYGLTDYNGADMMKAIDALGTPHGGTPLSRAIRRAKDDLAGTSGDMAMIIISDGEDISMEKKVVAARKVKERFGDRICIYTIQVGNDPKGRKILQEIAKAGGCGYFTTYEEVASVSGCTAFVKDVFLKRAGKKTARAVDSDGDGVPDDRDRCPNTPRGVQVDANGCPKPPKPGKAVTVRLNVEFDFDKYYIRPEFYPQLENFANYLKQYPEIQVEIDGHTDNVGSEDYNRKLSLKRAEAIRNYLLGTFHIKGDRLTTRGFGTSRPKADNKTREGRQRNRRVEAVLTTR